MSSATPVSNSSFNVDNFIQSLKCPIGMVLLDDAVHLHPCAHKVSEAVVKQLQKCPVCRTPIQTSYADHFVRGIVSALRSKDAKEALPQVSAKVKEEDLPYNKVAYPGNSAKFVAKKDFRQLQTHSGQGLFREIEFYSRTPDPFLKKINIYGYERGPIYICIHCSGGKERAFNTFLKDSGFLEELAWCGFATFSEKKDLTHLYKILVENNEFPDDQLKLMHDLVEAENWTHVTPLTEEEKTRLSE